MDNEQWKPIPGFPRYEVSDQGNVRSLRAYRQRGTVLKPVAAGRGYLQVTLCTGVVAEQRKRYIHHLVAEAFIGPRPPRMEVCHGAADFLDNRAVNLRYDTHSLNMAETLHDGTNFERNRTHCDHDHELTPDNVRTEKNGTYSNGEPKYRRRCKECLKVKSRQDYARRK